MMNVLNRFIAVLVLCPFLSSTVTPAVLAAGMPWMPPPGVAVTLSSGYMPAALKGMVINPTNPFKFDFLIHRGDEPLAVEQKQAEYSKLIKYFLAALAVPDTDQWVNLSPYEGNRIISNNFGLTEMGRDLLAQDYLLKQMTASLTDPNTTLGKKFWNAVYSQAHRKLGTTNIPTDTFNKVWIVPDKAVVYEKGNTVYVLESHLKVMMEKDYLAMKVNSTDAPTPDTDEAAAISHQVMKEVIIPALEKEINEGKNFAPLRQVCSGMLLASWYKLALKESILGKLYADQSKVRGVDQDPKNNQAIYEEYVQAFRKGVFNMIHEDVDLYSQEVIPRKYFSGGFQDRFDKAMERKPATDAAAAKLAQEGVSDLDRAETELKNAKNHDDAMLVDHARAGPIVLHIQSYGWTSYANQESIPDQLQRALFAGQPHKEEIFGRENILEYMAQHNVTVIDARYARDVRIFQHWPDFEEQLTVNSILYVVKFGDRQGDVGILRAPPGGQERVRRAAASRRAIDEAPVKNGILTMPVYEGRQASGFLYGFQGNPFAEILFRHISEGGKVIFLVPQTFVGTSITVNSELVSVSPGQEVDLTLFFRKGNPVISSPNVLTIDGEHSSRLLSFKLAPAGYMVPVGVQAVKRSVSSGLADLTGGPTLIPLSVAEIGAKDFGRREILRATLETVRRFKGYSYLVPNSVIDQVSVDSRGRQISAYFPSLKGKKNVLEIGGLVVSVDEAGFVDLTEAWTELQHGAAILSDIPIELDFSIWVETDQAKPSGILIRTSSSATEYREVPAPVKSHLAAGGKVFLTLPQGFSGSVSVQGTYQSDLIPNARGASRIDVTRSLRQSDYFVIVAERNGAGPTVIDARLILESIPDYSTAAARNGGIDLAQSNLDMQIKRDGKGVPLPVSQQDLEGIHINGLVPVILNIRPASDLSLFAS